MSPGQPDLRAVLYQAACWLGWGEYAASYDLGLQEEPHPLRSGESWCRRTLMKSTMLIKGTTSTDPIVISPKIPEPPALYCVYGWIQSLLTRKSGSKFLTLPEIYSTATHVASGDDLRRQIWDSATPRTLMFARLFERLGPASGHHQMVEAMHECGFTPRILESLPEAILTPLQDSIFMCQPNPPSSWPDELVQFVSRSDISSILKPSSRRGLVNITVCCTDPWVFPTSPTQMGVYLVA